MILSLIKSTLVARRSYKIKQPLLLILCSIYFIIFFIYMLYIHHKQQQMIIPLFHLLFVYLLILSAETATFQKYLLTDEHALCLDGSPGAYYLYKGSTDKVILYFEGGGWCGARDLASTIESCYQRSKTALGSSSAYPQTMSQAVGLLSDEPSNYFKDWTKVYLKYCDGSGHQGSASSPISYKDRKLYFRGQNVTIGQLESLDKQIALFSQVKQIMVSGGSAGGLATFLWTNYISDRASAQKVWSVPDSGIFLDAKNVVTNDYSYRLGFYNLFKLSNTETNPPVPECAEKYPNERHLCMFAENLHSFIKAPLFPIQSLYDSWSLPNILGIKCELGGNLGKCSEEQMIEIESYHRNTTNVLISVGSTQGNGFWAPVCSDHVYVQGSKYISSDFRIPQHSENSINECLRRWVSGEDTMHKYIDSGKWPDNAPCSGTSDLRTQ